MNGFNYIKADFVIIQFFKLNLKLFTFLSKASSPSKRVSCSTCKLLNTRVRRTKNLYLGMKFKLRKMQNYVKQLEGKGFIHFLLPNISFIRKCKFGI